MTLADFAPGDRVFYVLPKSPSAGRQRELLIPAVVSNVTKKRLVIKLDGHENHRCTLPKHVRKL